MSTLQDSPTTHSSPGRTNSPGQSEFSEAMVTFLRPLASLKLSVVLFALGIFLVLAGTLAQVEDDIWEVMSGYFRCWVAFIPFQVFFPRTWFPTLQNVPGGIYFPGGWTIGSLMTLNLLTAHSLRFKVQAKGAQVVWGGIVTLLGVILTWAIIEFGTGRDAIYETSNFSADFYWNVLRFGLLIPAIACGVAASRYAGTPARKVEFWTFGGISLFLLATSLFLIAGGQAVRLDNASMRILWQLIQATFAGSVLLGGCLLLFRKRAGIVLLHAGVLLLMANELVVHQLHEEANIILAEGETTNYAQDIRTSELFFMDRSHPEQDVQTVVPKSLLLRSLTKGEVIEHEDLPFYLKVREFYENSDLVPRQEQDANPATFGLGKTHSIQQKKKSPGTESEVDYPSAYVDLIDKETGEVRETALVSALSSALDKFDQISVDDEREYKLGLRFKRVYKPYSVHLIEARKDDYLGTSMPRNFSSEVRLLDETRNEDRRVKIWMNNPLRYSGETFYQSGYQKLGDQAVSTLQVVTNEGWMIPYIACMIVAIGMLYQFGQTLMRFLDRVVTGRIDMQTGGNRGRASGSEPHADGASQDGFVRGWLLAVVLVALCGAWYGKLAKETQPLPSEFDYQAFGRIPVAYEGRVQPLDTLARNSLRVLSSRETVRMEPARDKSSKGDSGPNEQPDKAQATIADDEPVMISATQWLLELVTRSDKALDRPVVKIDNEEVLSTLGLERRKSHRYSIDEIQPGIQKLIPAADQARKLRQETPEALSVYQRKVLELERKLGLVDLLSSSFHPPPIDPSRGNVSEQMQLAISFVRRLDERTPPLIVPPVPQATAKLEEGLRRENWETYSKAYLYDILFQGAFQIEPNPFSQKLGDIFNAYEAGEVGKFNKQVREYAGLLAKHPVEKIDVRKVNFEARFNAMSPFFWPAFVYVFAFMLAMAGWLLPNYLHTFNRASLCLIGLTFVVHTAAILARIYISGRPPVTNLYSSAVFIGWAVVLMGILFEWIYRLGIGNVLAGTAGFGSLWIAHGLSGDGDTFKVLQAVLDTQFWLSTHVVTVTLGYAATFVAGLLGVIYVFRRNPYSLLAVGGAVLLALMLMSPDYVSVEERNENLFSRVLQSVLAFKEQIPVWVRLTVPFLLAIPAAVIPLMRSRGTTPFQLTESLEKNLSRMIYGTLCFALWFSFVGTVLGGLWADDSWGRFWGWDPKENGALIIVLWNALVLHARWDRMISDRGLALLAIAGNIATSWSWFGVNELGVGLHSYGFTDGVLFNLSLFVLSQLTLIAIGLCSYSKKSSNLPV